jgi:hypothetical protein
VPHLAHSIETRLPIVVQVPHLARSLLLLASWCHIRHNSLQCYCATFGTIYYSVVTTRRARISGLLSGVPKVAQFVMLLPLSTGRRTDIRMLVPHLAQFIDTRNGMLVCHIRHKFVTTATGPSSCATFDTFIIFRNQ